MGCFLPCFGSSKDRKHRKRRHKVQPSVHRKASYNTVQHSTVSVSSVLQEISEKLVIPVSEVGVKAEEQLSLGARKKLTFDSNVETYEHVLPEEVADILPEASEDGKKEKEVGAAKSNQSQSSSEATSITSSGSCPPIHRYQNCRESYDEGELDYTDSDMDDDDDDEEDDGELDYDDVYEDDNDGIVESRIAWDEVRSKEVNSSIVTGGFNEEGVKSVMVNQAVRDRSAYVHSVLNPVENLTQWRALTAKGKPQLKQQKENSVVDQEPPRASFRLEPSFQEMSRSFKSKKGIQEIAVDTSLSNWLSSSATNKSSDSVSLNAMPEKVMLQGSSISVRSQDDRPILGALTLEEIKQFTAYNSPRKSPSRSPDEMPIIGTVVLGTTGVHHAAVPKTVAQHVRTKEYQTQPASTET